MYPYHHVRTDDGRESLTVFMPTGVPVVATGDHPYFADILEAAKAGIPADDLRAIADLSVAVAQRFDTLSERVSVADGRVYFDGDEVDSAITRQIVRCLNDPTVGDWKPLVRFMENVAANPNEHSREQLFAWLNDREFTITTDGCFIAYKGVDGIDGPDGETVYVSCSSGHGIVDGERHEGRLPNYVGATVEMPRSDVQHDPGEGCSTGLHVGTYEYAQSWAQTALLTVLVNPRDVVSVPTDCSAEKMRVCRYVVSDDEPTPPAESPAIAATEPEGRIIYSRVAGTPGGATFSAEFYVSTGETRSPREGEFYLFGEEGSAEAEVGRAVLDHAYIPTLPGRPILTPTEPQHGDYLPGDDGGEFYCAPYEVWMRAADYDGYADFMDAHADCSIEDA